MAPDIYREIEKKNKIISKLEMSLVTVEKPMNTIAISLNSEIALQF